MTAGTTREALRIRDTGGARVEPADRIRVRVGTISGEGRAACA